MISAHRAAWTRYGDAWHCMRCVPGPFEDVEGEMRMAMERGDPYCTFQEMRGCSVDPEHQHGKLGGFPPAQRLKRVLAET